jgi:hypothetical protein
MFNEVLTLGYGLLRMPDFVTDHVSIVRRG